MLFENLNLNQLETLSKLISIILCILLPISLFFASGYRILILILIVIILAILSQIEEVKNSKKQVEVQKRKTKIKNKLNKTFRKLKQNPKAFQLFVNFVKKWKDEKEVVDFIDSQIAYPRYHSRRYIDEKITFANLLQKKYGITIDITKNNEIRKFFGVPDEFEYLFDLIEQRELPKMMAEEEYQKFKRLTNDIKTRNIESYIDRFLDIYGDNWKNNIHNLKRLLKEKKIRYHNLEEQINKRITQRKIEELEKKLNKPLKAPSIILQEVDQMSGKRFEKFMTGLFEKMGYNVLQTKLSGDQGADLIIEKFGHKTAVQVKRWKRPVGNKAIQEIVAAREYYSCDDAMVVTNSTFTKSAIELAHKNKVKLVDRGELKKWIEKYL